MLERNMASKIHGGGREHRRYRPPTLIGEIHLARLLEEFGRGALQPKQLQLLKSPTDHSRDGLIYFAGDLSLLDRPSVAIVGSRQASSEGLARARRLARELAHAGFVVVSGLAAGIDSAAHASAIESGGYTAAVIGTPLNKAYPAENAPLQEQIYTDHVLLTPFAQGEPTYKSNFPKRNRVMAAITDATVIVEASDTSGTLHQAAECAKMGRWLFIAKSLVDNPALEWPKKFLGKPRIAMLTKTEDLIKAVIQEKA